MKAVRMSLAVAFVCCFTNFCPSLIAEEIKYLSPDGRFALRITQSKDDEYHPTVELIEKNSGKVMLTLHDASNTEFFDASESVLVWSFDSKRVAYGFRDSPPGARVLSLGAIACFWNGSGFDRVFLPENLPSPPYQIPERKRRECKTLWGRSETFEVVEVRRSEDVQRGDDALAG